MLEIPKSHLPQGDAVFGRLLGVDSISFSSWICVYEYSGGENRRSFFGFPLIAVPHGRVLQLIVR